MLPSLQPMHCDYTKVTWFGSAWIGKTRPSVPTQSIICWKFPFFPDPLELREPKWRLGLKGEGNFDPYSAYLSPHSPSFFHLTFLNLILGKLASDLLSKVMAKISTNHFQHVTMKCEAEVKIRFTTSELVLVKLYDSSVFSFVKWYSKPQLHIVMETTTLIACKVTTEAYDL